jgi:hypothetical protein
MQGMKEGGQEGEQMLLQQEEGGEGPPPKIDKAMMAEMETMLTLFEAAFYAGVLNHAALIAYDVHQCAENSVWWSTYDIETVSSALPFTMSLGFTFDAWPDLVYLYSLMYETFAVSLSIAYGMYDADFIAEVPRFLASIFFFIDHWFYLDEM